jgi:hypothetical protein
VPSPGVRDGELSAVAADTPSDAWAVGDQALEGLIEHWDGSRWQVVTSPHLPSGSALVGVSVTAADDAWAVGFWEGKYPAFRGFAIAEHWDGLGWSRVPTPGLRNLQGVAETSRNDVWAVGDDAGGAAVVAHWNGSQWQVPVYLPGDDLRSVAALSPTDVWVGGVKSQTQAPRYLELHWDGKRWSSYSQTLSPDDTGDPMIEAMGASGSRDVWAVGDDNGADGNGPGWAATVLLHWSGAGWRKIATPQDRFVISLAVRAPHDIAIAGVEGNGDAAGAPFLERRVGFRWRDAQLRSGDWLKGLAPDQQQGLWSVGYTGSHFDALGFSHHSQPLITQGTCS